SYSKEDVRVCLTYAMEARRRVKEQLKKLGGLEFFDVNFSYIDNETLEEFFVSVPEQGGSELIPAGMPKPGVVHLVTQAESG
ncbi:BREX system Lon protease-like protein BrxL, partial [Escherichia coli]